MDAKTRNFFLNISISILTLIFCIVVIEVYLRIDNWHSKIQPQEIVFNSAQYQLYEREDKFTNLKNSIIKNAIVFLGDSFTVGAVCGFEKNYPGAFEKLAHKHQLPYHTLNLAKSGTNTFDYLHASKDILAEAVKPAAGIVTLFHNDIEYSCALCRELADLEASGEFSEQEVRELKQFCEVCRRQQNAEKANFSFARKLHRWIFGVSYLYRVMRNASVALSGMIGIHVGWGAYYDQQWLNQSGLHYRLLQFSLERLVSEFKRANVLLLVVMYPPMKQITVQNPLVNVYEEIAQKLSSSLAMTVYSGYPAFLNSQCAAINMQWSWTDNHPNCRAHEIFASWVFEKFRKQQEVFTY